MDKKQQQQQQQQICTHKFSRLREINYGYLMRAISVVLVVPAGVAAKEVCFGIEAVEATAA